jgi:hypothetical protein
MFRDLWSTSQVMPIVVEAVFLDKYLAWLNEQE